MTELKLRYDDPKAGSLLLFESMEALSLGIEGKHSLWIVLATTAESSSSLQLLDYNRLKRRAEEQRERVEKLRIKICPTALTPAA